MLGAPQVIVSVHVRWWLRHYMTAVLLASWLTGIEPNMDRVGWWIERGLYVRARRLRMEIAA